MPLSRIKYMKMSNETLVGELLASSCCDGSLDDGRSRQTNELEIEIINRFRCLKRERDELATHINNTTPRGGEYL